MMRTDLLVEFNTLARVMSYTQTARELYISQPTLSKHMRELESETGLSLFDRTTDDFALTAVGQEFLRHSTRIIALYNAALKKCTELQEQGQSRLVIQDAPARTFMAYIYRIMKRYEQVNPFISYDFNVIWRYPDIFAALNEGVIDVALDVRYLDGNTAGYVEELSDHGYQTLVLPDDPLVVWFQRDHPFAEQDNVTLEDLVGTTLITSSGMSFDTLRMAVLDMFERHDATPQFEAYQMPTRATGSAYFLSDFGESVLLSTRSFINDPRIASRDDVEYRICADERLIMTPLCVARADNSLACAFLEFGNTLLSQGSLSAEI